MEDDTPSDPIPYVEHQRIIDELNERLDMWVEKYTRLSENYDIVRGRGYVLAATVRQFRSQVVTNLAKLDIRVDELEDALRARVPN